MARLSDTMRFELLKKAADIAIQTASTGVVGADVLASIIETTYKKMLELGEKELGEKD